MIAVLGATGLVGGGVAARLSGNDVRLLVRDPRRVRAAGQGVEADLRDPPSLEHGLRGCERLLLCSAHAPDQDRLQRNAILAARRAGVAHVVKVSGMRASLGPCSPAQVGRMHWSSERELETSGVGFTHVRPAPYMQNLPAHARGRTLPLPFGKASVAWVDAGDVSGVCTALLTDPDPYVGAVAVTGPAALTGPETAAVLGLRYVGPPRTLAGWALRRSVGRWGAELVLAMADLIRIGGAAAVSGSVERFTGQPARGLAEFAAELP